jgi:hypothetical protein
MHPSGVGAVEAGVQGLVDDPARRSRLLAHTAASTPPQATCHREPLITVLAHWGLPGRGPRLASSVQQRNHLGNYSFRVVVVDVVPALQFNLGGLRTQLQPDALILDA